MRLVAWQVATQINLWSDRKTSVAELMGEEQPPEDFGPGGLDAYYAAAAAEREAKAEAEAEGWDRGLVADDEEWLALTGDLDEDEEGEPWPLSET